MSTSNELLRRLFSIALCTSFVLALSVQGGLRQMVHVLGVLGVVAVVRKGRAPWSRDDRRLALALALFVGAALLSFAAHPSRYGASRLGLHVMMLLILPIAAGVRALRPDPAWLHGGTSIGAIVAGLYAAFDAYHPNVDRLDAIYARAGTGYHTFFGAGAAAFLFLSLSGIGWFASWRRLGVLIPLTAAAASLFGSIASASRGSWLAILAVGLVGALHYGPSMTPRLRAFAMAGAAALVLTIGLVPSLGVGTRIQAMASDLTTWRNDRATFSSLGGRFSAWQVAWGAFVDHPLVGVGIGNYRQEAERVLGKPVTPASYAASFDHPHSEYMAALGTRGLSGFVALLGLLGVVLLRFFRAARAQDPAGRVFGAAGFAAVASLAIWGLSDSLIEVELPAGLIVAVTGVLHGMLRAREDELEERTAGA